MIKTRNQDVVGDTQQMKMNTLLIRRSVNSLLQLLPPHGLMFLFGFMALLLFILQHLLLLNNSYIYPTHVH